MFIEPGEYLLITSSRGEHRFHVIGRNTFVGEEPLIHPTGKMVFSGRSVQNGATFVNHAGH
jgi:hypothetical protein